MTDLSSPGQRVKQMRVPRLIAVLSLFPLACGDDRGGGSGFSEGETGDSVGDGDGDPGDGDPGDGDPGDGDPGDGDPGDGDPGDGDGDTQARCPLALALVPCDGDDNDPLHALGLNCPGEPPETIPLSAVTFSAND